MPIHYEVHADDRVVVVSLIGALAVQEYASTAQKVLNDPLVQPGFALLVDGSALDPLPTFEELRALVQVAREMTAREIQPFGIVAANEPQYLVGRLFAMLAGATINLDVRVFRAKDVAYAWLAMKTSLRSGNRGGELGGAGT